jgi:uncharacterized protein DUF6894
LRFFWLQAQTEIDREHWIRNKPPQASILAALTSVGKRLRERDRRSMPFYHFKLVDTRIVGDHGTHHLADETTAQIEAIKLARSLRAARPELVGMHCTVSVTDENGAGICMIPLEIP